MEGLGFEMKKTSERERESCSFEHEKQSVP
jgi:hypothetical protein